jgi:uncharacterized ubiquitin-like protein YukD
MNKLGIQVQEKSKLKTQRKLIQLVLAIKSKNKHKLYQNNEKIMKFQINVGPQLLN